MAKLHRKELKHDEVREKMTDAVKSVSLHRREILYIIAIVVVVLVIAFGWHYYEKRQQEESQNLLGIALEKFESELDTGAVQDPNAPKPSYRYKTAAEKYSEALKDFEAVFQKYANTPAAEMARYHAGVSAFYLKDLGKAEKYLKLSAAVSDRNILYYQSRVALANLYNIMGKPEAVTVLKEAVEKNRNLIPPEYLWIQLAASYEKAGKKKEASDAYQKVVSQYKDSPISYHAQMRLNELKRK